MTGAGAADLAFVKGTGNDLIDIPSTPTYYEPGKDPVIEELSLDRALSRLNKPDQVFSEESIAGNIEGSFALNFVLEADRIGDVHDIVYSQTSGTVYTSGRAPTSRWYVGLDYLSGTAERVLKGCVPVSLDAVDYNQGEETRMSITFLYADEEFNTSITPSSLSTASGEVVTFHSTDFTLDSTTQSKEQSFALSISDISRFQYGSDAVAIDAVVANPTPELSVTTIFTEADQLELALGGSGQTTTSARMSEVSGTITLNAGGGSVASYSLSGLKPNNYSWADVIASDSDTTEDYTLHVNDVSL